MLIDRVISLSTAAGVEPVVVQQNDRESRTVRFFVYESSGVPLEVQGKTARIFFRKNGATSEAYEADVAADGWISLTVPDAVTAIPGNGEMQLAIVWGSHILHSFTIPFAVKGSLSFVGETETPEEDPMRIAWDTLPGKPDTFPPSAHTHTPAQAGALPANGTAADAAKLGGKMPGYYRRLNNLLVNSDFTNPVNQQGLTEYSGTKYMIDSWKGSACDLTVNTGSITVSRGSRSYGMLIQWLPAAVEGKTYTLAAQNTDGEIVTLTFVPEAGMASKSASFATSGHTIIARYSSTSNAYYIGVSTTSDTPISLVWMALYEGTHTVAELPEYVPKGWTAEYLDCVREYYYVPSGGMPGTGVVTSTSTVAQIAVVLPVPMTGNLTAKLLSAGDVRANGTTAAVQSIAVDGVHGNVVILSVTVASALPTRCAAALVNTGFELDGRL